MVIGPVFFVQSEDLFVLQILDLYGIWQVFIYLAAQKHYLAALRLRANYWSWIFDAANGIWVQATIAIRVLAFAKVIEFSLFFLGQAETTVLSSKLIFIQSFRNGRSKFGLYSLIVLRILMFVLFLCEFASPLPWVQKLLWNQPDSNFKVAIGGVHFQSIIIETPYLILQGLSKGNKIWMLQLWKPGSSSEKNWCFWHDFSIIHKIIWDIYFSFQKLLIDYSKIPSSVA